jgi:hypothetical protein
MSFRPFPLLLATALVACASDRGPLQSNPEAFAYSATLPNGMPVLVRNLRGAIEVEPSPDDSLRVTASTSWRGDADYPRGLVLSAASLPTGVLVCAIFGEDGACTPTDYKGSSKNSFRLGGSSDVSVTFRLQVPAGVSLDLLGVDTRIISASSAPVKARTINGDVTVVTAVGPVRAETMNGDVDARMTTLTGPDSVVVKTMNGSAWAFLPESVAAMFEVSTLNGRVNTDFPSISANATGKSLRGALGGGGTPVKVQTLNGTAGLGRLDAEGRSYQR